MRRAEIRTEAKRIAKVCRDVSWRYLNKRRAELFPDRQILLRQRDQIKSFPLSSRHQVIAASSVLLCGIWMVWASVGYFYSSHKVAVKQGQILTTLVAYEDMVNQVASERDKLVSITSDLDYYRSYLTALVEQNQAGQKDAKAARADDAETAHIAETEKALQDRLTSIKGEISGFTQASTQLTEGAGKLSSQLAGVGTSKSDKIDSAVARAALGFRVAQLEKQLAESSSQITDLRTALSVEQQSAEQALQSRRIALDEKAELAEKLAVAEKRVVDISAAHEQSLGKLAEQTHSTIAQIERIMVATGIDAKRILQMSGGVKPARGGPFVPWRAGQSKEIDLQNTPATATLTFDIDRINQLKQFISTIPLGSPLTQFMVSGPFGYRIDPFNSHPAYHTGLDMLAPMGTQAVATAPGKVITARWSGDYGNMVEVDHGYGIVTRYAHLQKFDVTEGQMVALHDPIGRVGQTGRAEAPHLHYEVRVDGEARNPINFLRAISNVLVTKTPKSPAPTPLSDLHARTREVPSIIGPEMTVTGNIKSDGEIQIEGLVHGDIVARAVTIGENASVYGEVAVDTVRLHGRIEGRIKAREVVLLKTARMLGDVHHESLAIEAGAQLEGLCKRLDGVSLKDEPPEPAAQQQVIADASWEPVAAVKLAVGE